MSQSKPLYNEESRQYFRVILELPFQFERLKCEAYLDGLSEHDAKQKLFAKAHPNALGSKQCLAEIDAEVASLRDTLQSSNPVLVRLLQLMDNKLQLLSNLLLNAIPEPAREASISTGGMGFMHDEELPENSLVILRLALPPQQLNFMCHARVVRTRYLPKKDPDAPYQIGLRFLDPPEQDMQLLQEFLLQQQLQGMNL